MMQKINIKKVTKEQMLKMLEEAQDKQETAESKANELREQLAISNKAAIATSEEYQENTAKLRGQIGELTVKLEENEKALEEVTAKYKSADHSAAMLRSRIDEAEKLRDQALEAHGEDMKAIEKAKNENRELAHLLGKRELELAEAKQRRDDTLREMDELKGQLKAAEGRANYKDKLLDEALFRLDIQKSIAEDYHSSLKWCMAHPWRNVWRCAEDYFRF